MEVFIGLPIKAAPSIDSPTQQPAFRQWLRQTRIEPHITLWSPQILGGGVTDWATIVKRTVTGLSSIRLQTQELTFINASTLVIMVAPQPLEVLHRKLNNALGTFKPVEPELAFKPHVTIGRAKSRLAQSERSRIVTALGQPKPTEFCLDVVRAYRRLPDGTYERWFDCPLA